MNHFNRYRCKKIRCFKIIVDTPIRYERVHVSFAKHMERSVDSTNTLNFVAVMNDVDIENISVYRENWYSQILFFSTYMFYAPRNKHTYVFTQEHILRLMQILCLLCIVRFSAFFHIFVFIPRFIELLVKKLQTNDITTVN